MAIAGLPAPSRAAEAPAEIRETASAALNVRDFGAIGDGRIHRVREWIESGRFSSERKLRAEHPFVDTLDWTIDEVAFEQAKRALPPSGGTIHFPVGHYVAGRHGWRIWQDNVRLTGEGPERTILSTAPEIPDGLSVAPYRHVGWREGAQREFPFTADSGGRGRDFVELKVPEWSSEFEPGELVFLRNGANRYDQDYGEFNEVARADASGRLYLKHPLSRDYTLARFNWAGQTVADFKMPAPNRTVKVQLRTGEGFFIPPRRATITIGTDVFRVEHVGRKRRGQPVVVRLWNPGRANSAPGTLIPAGSRTGKSRTVLKLTRSVRNFRCENLKVVGRRKALVISNTYHTAFADCVFVRDLREGGFKGGLTIDGDGGRFARFDRCRIVALPPAGMQFARSFGGVVFAGCTFDDANAAFTEFNFDCEVSRCTFEVEGTRHLTNVIVAGKSCGDLRILDNRIRARGVQVVFDTHSDIQSQKHGSEGDFIVRGNAILTENVPRLFTHPRFDRLLLEDNRITAE